MKKKTNKINRNFFNLRLFVNIITPTHYINYKMIEFAPSNKSNMANKLYSPTSNDF